MTDVTMNLLWLRPGAVGGSERYVTQLLKSLSQVKNRPSIELVVSPETNNAYPYLAHHFGIDEQKTFEDVDHFSERHANRSPIPRK